MPESTVCPRCGQERPGNSPQGLCPVCLLQRGFAAQPENNVAVTTPLGGRFVPPTNAQIESSLPSLEVLELVGQGGMGAVYKVRQKSLDRIVALKLLPPEVGSDPSFAERFAREAKALARLSHPNVLTIFEFGEAQGLYYLLMEYVDGVNLRQAIQAHTLSPQDCLAVVQQICDALQYAHDEGIVHRDIKPENVLLDKRGRVKIADFGLAKLLGRSPMDITLTAAHQVMGTLHYMAPEQMEHPLDVDHRADIYSLGVVFYELLTGQLPLGRFPLPSEKVDIGKSMDDVVLKTLERDPDRRYQQASAVKTDVQSYQHSTRPEVHRPVSKRPMENDVTSSLGPLNPGVLVMSATLAIAGLAMLALGLGLERKNEHGYLWTGIGTIIGAGAVAARAWSTRRASKGPIVLQDAGTLLFGATMFVVGTVLLLAGYVKSRSEFIWVGFAFIAGSGSIARGAWPSDEEEELPKPSAASLLPEQKPFPLDQPNPAVRARIRHPAIALIVTGVAHLLMIVLLALASFFITIPQRHVAEQNEIASVTWPILIVLVTTIAHGLLGALQLAAATQMLRTRWRGFAIVVSILSMVPTGPVSLFSIPFGIWSLVVLLRADVRHEFELEASAE